jgi:hypothetical protein
MELPVLHTNSAGGAASCFHDVISNEGTLYMTGTLWVITGIEEIFFRSLKYSELDYFSFKLFSCSFLFLLCLTHQTTSQSAHTQKRNNTKTWCIMLLIPGYSFNVVHTH